MLLGAFSAAAAAAQSSQSYSVINNTDKPQSCSISSGDGRWLPWFPIQPGATWTGASGLPELRFQCQPPVAQINYGMKPGVTYRLVPFGTEVRLVEVQGQ